ncbi:MAG: ABC-type transport system, involved in lipoprotein release, permease component [Deltaproteobacteria bacterium]|nr:ABC-type transport system, involved in lipoprotein release, permease component [Deltaproteobacteria bacterium]
MRALNRKLVRDLYHLRGPVAAIGLVVACGVAAVVTTRTAYDSLLLSRASYYAEYRFGHVFARLKRAPESLAAEMARIAGVTAVLTRVVFDVTLDIPGLAEPAIGRLISIPERRGPMLNDLYIRSGRYVEPGRRNEVLVSEAFAAANRLQVGDAFGAVLNGRWERLRIVGIALSPEYVYEIRGTDMFPDNKRFGVMWMSREAMGPAFDMDGAFNDVVLALAAGSIEAEVVAQIDRLLERYGGLGAYGRTEQISARFLADEIAQNRVSGTVIPMIFLGVAAFLLNIVLSRLVSMQRDQIAVLKAFGYSSGSVARHYLAFALIAVLAGALLGTTIGLWLGALINRMYVQFYRFPVLRYVAGPSVVFLAIGVSTGAALVGAFATVRRVIALPPAEAMRPEAPARFGAGVLERIGVRRLLWLPGRMIARNLLRRPSRAVLSVLSIALAVGIVVVGRYFVDAVRYLADVQFRVVQREDVSVSFNNPLSARARYAMARLPGVIRAEPFRVVPVRLRFAHATRRVPLMGLEPGAELRRLIDKNLRVLDVPADGIALTAKLAEILGVGPGDAVTVEVLEAERPIRSVVVTALVDELVGLSAYMELHALNQLLREAGVISGALLAVDPVAAPRLYADLKRTPAVAGVTIRAAALASFEETLAKSLGIFTTVLVVFACVIAVAMVYNTARVALSERGRELASLRVLGFTRDEVTMMLLGEQAVLTVIAIPLGFAMGYRVCAIVARAYQWEIFRLPLVVNVRTYAFALIVVLAAAVLSGVVVRRRLDRLDLVAVLKTRE